MNIFKLLNIPSGERTDVKAFKTSTLPSNRRQGSFSGDTQPEAEVFTTKEDAEKFAGELRAALKLLKYSFSLGSKEGRVTVESNNN